MILGRYEEVVGELYCESKEEEVMGSFLALTTGADRGKEIMPLTMQLLK